MLHCRYFVKPIFSIPTLRTGDDLRTPRRRRTGCLFISTCAHRVIFSHTATVAPLVVFCNEQKMVLLLGSFAFDCGSTIDGSRPSVFAAGRNHVNEAGPTMPGHAMPSHKPHPSLPAHTNCKQRSCPTMVR